MRDTEGRRGRSVRGQEESVLLELLDACFSKAEIKRLLARALLTLDAPGRKRLIERLGKEIGGTLHRLLESGGKVPGERHPAPGRGKILQEWRGAWSDWDCCIAESGDEHGQYVIRDYHWEEPYLDVSAMGEDLEPIAARVSKLLPRVADADLDPGFSFIEAVEQSVDEIGSGLPEWMAEWDEGYLFGPQVTSCLLEWEWRTVCGSAKGCQTGSAFAFIDRIRKIEAGAGKWSLDSGALVRFVLALNADHQREVLAGIEESRRSSH